MQAQTVRSAFEHHGVGVHTGEPGWVRVEPAESGAGLLAILEGSAPFSVDASNAHAVGGATVLSCGGASLFTPEHLLAALVGCGVTDALLVATGPEVPVLDGSALPWVASIREVGLRGLGRIEPLRPGRLRVEAHGGVAEVWPSDRGRVEVEVDFDGRGPEGVCGVDLDGDSFAAEVAWARTFVLAHQVEALRAAGRGRGATAENTVIWGGPNAPAGARSPDEAVRHKLLDLIGDLALMGGPVCARIRVSRGSHALHHALVAALRAGH